MKLHADCMWCTRAGDAGWLTFSKGECTRLQDLERERERERGEEREGERERKHRRRGGKKEEGGRKNDNKSHYCRVCLV